MANFSFTGTGRGGGGRGVRRKESLQLTHSPAPRGPISRLVGRLQRYIFREDDDTLPWTEPSDIAVSTSFLFTIIMVSFFLSFASFPIMQLKPSVPRQSFATCILISFPFAPSCRTKCSQFFSFFLWHIIYLYLICSLVKERLRMASRDQQSCASLLFIQGKERMSNVEWAF